MEPVFLTVRRLCGGAVKSTGWDWTASRSPSKAAKFLDGRLWLRQRALRGETVLLKSIGEIAGSVKGRPGEIQDSGGLLKIIDAEVMIDSEGFTQ